MSENCVICKKIIPIKYMSYHISDMHNIHNNPTPSEQTYCILSPSTYNFGMYYFEKNNLLYNYDTMANSIINEAIFNNKKFVIVTYNDMIHEINLHRMTIKIYQIVVAWGLKY